VLDRKGVAVLTPLVRDDVPDGLVFSLGYAIDPGSRLVFVRTSHARTAGEATGSFLAQTRDALSYVRDTLRATDPEARLVKVRRHMTDARELRSEATRAAWKEAFGASVSGSTALQVNGSCLLGSVLDMEAWGVTPDRRSAAPLERVGEAGRVPDAVAVRGDQSLRVGVHLSSAGLDDPALDHLRSCLDAVDDDVRTAGGGGEDLVKLTVYCPDARLWQEVESEVLERYGDHCPVVSGMLVSTLLSPASRFGVTAWSRCPSGSASSMSLGNRTLALTGTGALDIFVGGQAADMYARPVPPTIEDQAEQVMVNQRKVLEAAGATFDHVFRSNWYLTDIREWPLVEAAARRHFDRDLPAPMVIEVPRLVAKPGVRVEPDLWASLPAGSG
jgi:enamine deaminase RidA (YjgF/YER057c/UK114 family)